MNPAEFVMGILKNGLETIGKYYGIYAAQVVDNQDPETRGRVKIFCPTIAKDAELKAWAEPCFQIVPGGGYGGYYRPEVDDWIWVSFVHGNLDKPVWLGGWWAKKELAPIFDQAVPGIIGGATKYGHYMIYDDKNKKIKISTKDGHYVEIDDKNEKIELKTPAGVTATLDNRNKKIVLNSTFDQLVMKEGGIYIGSEGSGEYLVLGLKWLNWASKAWSWANTVGGMLGVMPSMFMWSKPNRSLLSDRHRTEKGG